MLTREYGTAGPVVVLLHGGPGAAGYMAPVARELAGSFRVLEPFQRGSGAEPLTVARHVQDLHELIESRCAGAPPAVVGHSWGAMLALAFAAAHPRSAVCLVLVGCGTFDPQAREQFRRNCEERTSPDLRQRLERLAQEVPDPNERLRATGDLLLPLYSCDPVEGPPEFEACDARAHQETWDDMLRLQAEGAYPAAFAAIRGPVLMLHGAADPHPGRMIRASLAPYLPQLEYREWDRCGHYPWLEKAAWDEFYSALRDWLVRQFTAAHPRARGG
jgi:pimeloyl-ACP methyl ester carboxylesterase